MPYNDLTAAFVPQGGPFAPAPAIRSVYHGLTTAQLTAQVGSPVGVLSTGSLVEAAKTRKTFDLYVPTAQAAVVVGNTSAPNASTNGFIIPPGSSIRMGPFNDSMYALCPTGTSLVFFTET